MTHPQPLPNDYPAPDTPLLRHTAFLPSPPPATASSLPADTPQRESVRILVIGTAASINAVVQNLHQRGFAHISEWSPLLPHDSGQLMRILTRWVQHSP